ncbi:hypothetical protein XNA1_3980004 [Xenorhabdus nematophila str. Anatoliense]|nr:hypothetical protein XNA1_3980004 [Xenorhabdus nematophila str. Anatoliense]
MPEADIRIPVYPRTYGEHCGDINLTLQKFGLSPYLRGTLIK